MDVLSSGEKALGYLPGWRVVRMDRSRFHDSTKSSLKGNSVEYIISGLNSRIAKRLSVSMKGKQSANYVHYVNKKSIGRGRQKLGKKFSEIIISHFKCIAKVFLSR